MPHLTIEYSANVGASVDMAAFCRTMRDAMMETGIFPLGGIRVRAFPCEIYVIADDDPSMGYLNMICRIGAGREEKVRLAAAEQLYEAAEKHLKPLISFPFALSLDLAELDPVTSLKRWNTIHDHLKSKA